MPSDPRRVKELFAAALERPDEPDRRAFLDEACGDDPDLRQRLDVLLAAHGRGHAALGPPMAAPRGTEEETRSAPSPGEDSTAHHPAGGAEGVVIAGRYTLLERIGEGGMGEVWVAKQTDPVTRKVAVKLIKPGMDSRRVVARFEAERQALALMDHPNIARVLDGGLTEAGRPFFVMELVNGLPLSRFCDEAKLTPRERLELFIPVCQAVQHAHQKGVVHRDLKPGNVLVTLYDGRPVPKVIDFGVAKAVGGKLTDHTLSTQFGAVVGTLGYMAPEQAGFSALDVDTRADVYSLGVILYELLTGLRPFDGARLRRAAFDEALRIVREEDPPRPSTRLSTDESLPSVAAVRRTDPRRLTALMRGELDWVVMKCLEKDRGRRYETASGLGRDVQRYLADEPVEARPPSAGYRARKFLRRNRGPALAAGLVVLLLVGGVAGTTVGLVQAEHARRAEAQQRQAAEAERDEKEQARREAEDQQQRAQREKARADGEAATAKAVNDFLLEDLLKPASWGPFALGPKAPPNPNLTVRELLGRAESRAGERLRDRPLIEAAVREVIAQSYLGLSRQQFGPAIRNLERSADLKAAHLGAAHPAALEVRVLLAGWYLQAGQDAPTLRDRCHQTLDHARDAVAALPDPLADGVRNALQPLASVYVQAGKPQEAVTLYRRLLRGDDSKDRTDTVLLTERLGAALRAAGQASEADAVAERAGQAIAPAAEAADDWGRLLQLGRVAAELERAGRRVDWEPIFRRLGGLAAAREAAGDSATAQYWMTLGEVYELARRRDEAIRAYERCRDGFERPAAGGALPRVFRASVYQNLGDLYLEAGRPAEAAAAFRRYLAAAREVGLSHSMATTELFVAALGLRRAGRPDEAIPPLREACELNRKAEGPDSSVVAGLESQLGLTYLEAGQPAEAVRVLDELIKRLKPTPESRSVLRYSHQHRARAYEALGRFDRAAADWDACVSLSSGPDRTIPLSFRALDRLRSGQVASALKDAEELAAAGGPVGLYNAACVYARAAGRDDLAGGNFERENHAARSVELLRQATGAGFSNLTEIAADDDLESVRDRPGFAAVLAELGKKDPAGYALAAARLAHRQLDRGRSANHLVSAAEAAIRKSPRAADHPDTLAAHAELADGLQSAGRWEEALPHQQAAFEGRRKVLGPDAPETLLTLNNLAWNHQARGRLDLAVPLFEEGLRLRQARFGAGHPETAAGATNLAGAYELAGRWADAERLRRETLEQVGQRDGKGSPAHAGQLAGLGLNLLGQQRYDEAEQVLRECLALRERADAAAWTRCNTRSALGGALLGQGRYAEAEPLLLEGYEGLKRQTGTIPPAGRVRLPEAADRLVALYEAWGKPADLARWRAERAHYGPEVGPPPREVVR